MTRDLSTASLPPDTKWNLIFRGCGRIGFFPGKWGIRFSPSRSDTIIGRESTQNILSHNIFQAGGRDSTEQTEITEQTERLDNLPSVPLFSVCSVLPLDAFYSHLKATIGSIFVARRAGM